MPAPKRKASARSQSASAFSSSTSTRSSKVSLPRAWQPPTASIPAGQSFDLKPQEYYPTAYSDIVHWNAVPVFKPSWDEFKDFYTYCRRIRAQGMEHGIVKIVPPQEWLDMQGDLSERLANLKIVSPLRQIVQPGGEGAYQQTNQPQEDRTFSVREWADLCASAAHRGPELKKIQDRLAERYRVLELIEASKQAKRKPKKKQGQEAPQQDQQAESSTSHQSQHESVPSSASQPQPSQQLPTPPQSVGASTPHSEERNANASVTGAAQETPLPTPAIESFSESQPQRQVRSPLRSTETQPPATTSPVPGVDATGTMTTTTAETTGAAPSIQGPDSDWDYKRAWMSEYLPASLAAEAKDEDWTIDVCAEIEIEYWRSLGALRSNGASSANNAAVKGAWYGADQCGTLFDEDMRVWNIAKLDNVLTRMLGCIDENDEWRDISLDSDDDDEDQSTPSRRPSKNSKADKASGSKKGKGKASEGPMTSKLDNSTASAIAGVTTPYLYFGQWQATFSWHVEDMDLCSINYIHFGAPKQWYSIPQPERHRFETAMKASFPNDSNRCKQFLRHKSYLVNPSRLASIKPLKLVQHAGEIVLTFPYGYHSGYNLGFNCAESTNFALDDWVQMGMDAQVCQCADRESQVNIDVARLYQEAIAAQKEEDQRAIDDGSNNNHASDTDSDKEFARPPPKAKRSKRASSGPVKAPTAPVNKTPARRQPTKDKGAAATREQEAIELKEKERAATLRHMEAAALQAEDAMLQLERARLSLHAENTKLQLENERLTLKVENARLQMENERLQLGADHNRLQVENERLKLEVRLLREQAYGKRN